MESIGGSLSELYIEENFGGGKLRIQDFTEPLLIIEYFEESEKTELLRKSLHQLLAISEKYKNILLISHHESLKIILTDVTVFFQDRKFFFASQEYLKRPEFYRLSFFSQRKLQYFKISVDIGNSNTIRFRTKVTKLCCQIPTVGAMCTARTLRTLPTNPGQFHPPAPPTPSPRYHKTFLLVWGLRNLYLRSRHFLMISI